MMSPKLQDVLFAAGWHPGRRIQPTSIVANLTAKGFIVHDAAIRFFREFGQLVLCFGEPGQRGCAHILEIKGIWPDMPLLPVVADLDRQVGPLVPVVYWGESPFQKYHMMAPDGRVFAFIDAHFGDPHIDDVIWGPQPDGISALDAEVNHFEWPVWRGHDEPA